MLVLKWFPKQQEKTSTFLNGGLKMYVIWMVWGGKKQNNHFPHQTLIFLLILLPLLVIIGDDSEGEANRHLYLYDVMCVSRSSKWIGLMNTR